MKSGIDYGTGPLPYEPSAAGAPQNTIPGGASLWAFAGHPDRDYAGVAAFFAFLSRTDIQSRLHRVSGYLPVTMAAYDATKASGFYDDNPGREQPILQMIGKPPTANSRGVRAINLPELREIQNEEFEIDARRPAIRATGARQRSHARERGDPGSPEPLASAAVGFGEP